MKLTRGKQWLQIKHAVVVWVVQGKGGMKIQSVYEDNGSLALVTGTGVIRTFPLTIVHVLSTAWAKIKPQVCVSFS